MDCRREHRLSPRTRAGSKVVGWYLEAVDRLRRGGLRQHALDPCAFLIYKTDDDNYTEHDPVHQQVNSLGAERLVGMVIMRVDDVLGAGCPNSPRYAAKPHHIFSAAHRRRPAGPEEYVNFVRTPRT